MAKLVIGTDKTVGVPAVVQVVVPADPYPLLSRVKDDNNNEIGTVCGYHTDASNQKYAVVCLDAQYRGRGAYMSPAGNTVTDLPAYSNQSWENAKETATFNCDKILAYAAANNYTSTGVNLCRSKSFVIGGTTYYGQLPTVNEMISICRYMTEINALDSSAESYPNYILTPTGLPAGGGHEGYISSTQKNYQTCYDFDENGGLGTSNGYKQYGHGIVPILEIPIV